MMKTLTLTLSTMIALTLSAAGQSSIATNNFQPPAGSPLDILSKTGSAGQYASVVIDSGADQSWDVTTLFSGAFEASGEIVTPSTAPDIDSFPAANLVIRQIIPSGLGFDLTNYSYNHSQPQSFEELGFASSTSGFSLFRSIDRPVPEYSFPIAYGDQWTRTAVRTEQTSFAPEVTHYDTTEYHVDAWGTLTYESQTVDVIRVNLHRRTTTTGLGTDSTFETHFLYFFNLDFEPVAILIYTPNEDANFTLTLNYFGTPTDITENPTASLPQQYTLSQNYPNPFNPTTDINFTLPRHSHVQLTVYNTLGQEIRTLVDKTMSAGSYTVDWNGTDDNGSSVASGVYLYRLTSDNFSESKKMMLLK